MTKGTLFRADAKYQSARSVSISLSLGEGQVRAFAPQLLETLKGRHLIATTVAFFNPT